MEAELAQHAAVAESAVVGITSREWGETPVAYVVLRPAAAGLEAPAVDREYGCWLEEGGAYRWIGRMRFGGAVAGWAGPVIGLDALADDAVFRVSLDKIGGQAPEAPVLWGRPSLP